MVLNSFDFIITTSISDSECMWVYDCASVRLKGRCPNPNVARVVLIVLSEGMRQRAEERQRTKKQRARGGILRGRS